MPLKYAFTMIAGLFAASLPETGAAQEGPRATRAIVVQVLAQAARDCRIVAAEAAETPDPLATGWQLLSMPSITCNYRGSPTVRLWSLNSGALAPDGAVPVAQTASLPYELRIGGQPVGRPGGTAAPLSAVLPLIEPLLPRPTEIALRFVDGAGTPAGDFADTIYLEVIP
ncbi:hypothetical protein HGI47_17695 [Novosphingobium sp. ERN07]|nr:hypothetical protein [Novosphingobium sp. ERN07]